MASPASPALYDEPVVATVGMNVIAESLRAGFDDFMARPTTAIFLVVIYPFIGLLLYRFAFNAELLPLLFPIASGFALIGPLAAVGLYELSRRREQALELDGVSAFGVLTGDVMIPVLQIGLLLLAIYAAWLGSAQLIYQATMGGYAPQSLVDLLWVSITTPAGWALIVLGFGVGFLFALVVLAVGAISLPAVFDRQLSAGAAVGLSVRAFLTNTRVMLAWGFVVAVGLAIASLPAFIGLMVALPIFGHATWHLYRRLVPHG